MNRRSFFSALAGSPLILFSSKPLSRLEIDVDLSVTGLQWAVLCGQQRGYGKPLTLHISRELQFIAHQITESRYEPYIAGGRTANPLYHVAETRIDKAVPCEWELEFEHGRIRSGIV
jgi:hypothetical protein